MRSNQLNYVPGRRGCKWQNAAGPGRILKVTGAELEERPI
jgi:hypothetical protein